MAGKKRNISGVLSDIPELTTEDKIKDILGVLKTGFEPKIKEDLDEWSDKHRFLPTETSSEWGQWRTSRFPFLRRIMKCLSPSSKAKTVTAIKGCQLGFTEVCINWILYIADVTPSAVIYCQKTKDAAEDFASQKLEPNIKICEKVYHTLGAGKPKDLKNELTTKAFPGGYIDMGGASTEAFLKSKSVPYAMTDEEDSYKTDIDGNGSPIGMLEKRMVNFPRSKLFRLSTPKYTETSTIWQSFLEGSQEHLYLPCPECNPKLHKGGHWFILNWSQVGWDEDKVSSEGIPEEVWYTCTSCGCRIPENKKTWMMANGKWMSEKGSEGKPYEVGDVLKPSFHISSLYSPLGFFSWKDAAEEWIRYQKTKDPALLQVFINQTLGETFSLTGQEISSNWLYERREKYRAPLPAGVLYVTAGVDCQKDRLECEIVGWGLNNESWSIDYLVLEGDTEHLGDAKGNDPYGNQSVWSKLDEYLLAEYQHELGHKLRVSCTAIDASFKTDIVNTYCKYREHFFIYPIQGRDGWKKGLLKRPNRRHENYGTVQFTLWVDELKQKVYSYLKIPTSGPGFCHFPEKYDQKHFKQLTAEYLLVENKTLKWKCPAGARNEQLDCRAYAIGALAIAAPNLEYRAQQLMTKVGEEGTFGLEEDSTAERMGHLKPEQAAQNNRRMLPQLNMPKKKKVLRRRTVSKGVW